jgi:hypothetical protein
MPWQADSMNTGSLILRNRSHFHAQRDLLNQNSGLPLESVQYIIALFGLNPTGS